MSMPQWFISQLLNLPYLANSGHLCDPATNNLGLGLIYYAFARVYNPRNIVVIGSHRGFVPIVFARALKDNNEGGRVCFIDPSMADDFWKNPDNVYHHFREFGLNNIDHYCMTTEEYMKERRNRAPLLADGVGILFIDGMHTAEAAEYDYESFSDILKGPAFFHDSLHIGTNKMYGKPYIRSVGNYVQHLRDYHGSKDVIEVELNPGLAIVNKVPNRTLRRDRTGLGLSRKKHQKRK
jgi:hypothetical protein